MARRARGRVEKVAVDEQVRVCHINNNNYSDFLDGNNSSSIFKNSANSGSSDRAENECCHYLHFTIDLGFT